MFHAPTGIGVLPGAGNGGVERQLSRGTMRPHRAPTRGAPTVIGDWSDRAARNRPSSGRLEVAPPGKEHGARETRPSQSARERRRLSKRRPEGRRSQSAPRTTPLPPGVRHWKFQRKRRRGDRKVPPPDPVRNRAGIVRRRRTPRCRCRTTRRGDPCGRPPPERRHRPPAIAWALPKRGGGERRLSGADWDRRPSGRREWRRGAATKPGDDATPQGTHKGCPYRHIGHSQPGSNPRSPGMTFNCLRKSRQASSQRFRSSLS